MYAGGVSTFELQLAEFVEAVQRRRGAESAAGATAGGSDATHDDYGADGVANMALIDEIYEAAGLGMRPSRVLDDARLMAF